MRTYKKLLPFAVAGALLFSACQQEKIVGPIEKGSTPPGTVGDVQVVSLNGGARISYTLPKDADLFYVEADYEIRPGVMAQVKSSYYGNSLTILGFGDTNEHKVEIYAVDRGENKSEPVTVMVTPLIPPVQAAYKTLAYDKDFGGIHASFRNETSADLVVNIMIKDSAGEWQDYDKYYSSLPDNVFAVRGLPAVPTQFGIFIKDRWDNHSDTLNQELTPIYEEQLDKSKFNDMTDYLPGSPEPYSGSYHMVKMWDDNLGSMYHTTQDVSKGAQFPLHFAFDLGAKAKLSRMKLWPRQGSWAYQHGNVKDMEIWGTNEDPGSWGADLSGWQKLGEYHCFKPSGSPVGTNTDADIEQSVAGQDISFPIADPAVRYIMFKVIDNWSQPPNSPGGFCHIAEVTFWGQPQP